MPGQWGLSVEQRKRLTIAVELVANPSVVFMDEPTSGLDARAGMLCDRTHGDQDIICDRSASGCTTVALWQPLYFQAASGRAGLTCLDKLMGTVDPRVVSPIFGQPNR
jgi:hypothetical protein